MIEDDIYRTSSQFRLWSYTETSLRSLRAKTNAAASERVRTALRRAREAQQSTASSAVGTPMTSQPGSESEGKGNEEKEIDCLTPEEELVFVRYYCEQLLELGETYKPPLPTLVRVSLPTLLIKYGNDELTSIVYATGNRNPVPPPLLSVQLAHDLQP